MTDQVEATQPETSEEAGAPISNNITMASGEVISFGAKGILKKLYEIVGEGKKAVINAIFNLRNGEQHSYEITKEHPLLLQLAAHGLMQKVGDAAAGCSPADASLAVQKMIAQLEAGVWAQRSAGGNKGMTDFLSAVLAVKGIDPGSEEAEKARVALLAMDDDAQTAIRKMPTIQAEINKIVQARKTAKLEEQIAEGVDNSALDALELG